LSLIDESVKGVMTKDAKTIEATRTVMDAVRTMRDAKIGCLVVLGKDRTPVGIFTERDLVVNMADDGHGALASAMAEVMSKPLTIISPSATIWDALTLMGRADIRRLPVVENGRLIGILTERDVFRLVLSRQGLLLESVSESLPTATGQLLRRLSERLAPGTSPGRASDG
jgi:CBS domain-containing protein